MGQALYRNYRPKSFSEVVGQDHITKTLQNAIKNGRISHAYLFAGPRGVGKTSVARILAHEVNSLTYNDESIHLDIIEIDAASNRRIDEIRDLRERVRIAPAAAKYKVYIIDEVHMLTREAFNALLKTLEEPPAHCIFILATTEAAKLPETIVSRTQRFEFKPVGTAQAVSHLEVIARSEKLTIDKPALELLAEFGAGSFRDSISYLDQLSSYGKKISEADVRDLLGLPASSEIDSLMDSLETGDPKNILSQLKTLEGMGITARAVASAISNRIRDAITEGRAKAWQIKLLRELLEVSASVRSQEVLEVVMLEACAHVPAANTLSGVAPAAPAIKKPAATKAEALPPKVQNVEISTKTLEETDFFNLDMWEEVIERSKKQAASIYTALRLAKPSYSDGTLVLAFQFPLHQKKLNQSQCRELISQIIKDIGGGDVRIETALDELAPDINHQPLKPAPASVISSIFGNTEVLDS